MLLSTSSFWAIPRCSAATSSLKRVVTSALESTLRMSYWFSCFKTYTPFYRLFILRSTISEWSSSLLTVGILNYIFLTVLPTGMSIAKRRVPSARISSSL